MKSFKIGFSFQQIIPLSEHFAIWMHLLKQHLEYLISNIFSSKATEKFKVVCHNCLGCNNFWYRLITHFHQFISRMRKKAILDQTYIRNLFSFFTFQSWEIFVEDFGENMWWVPNKRTGISLENEKKKILPKRTYSELYIPWKVN